MYQPLYSSRPGGQRLPVVGSLRTARRWTLATIVLLVALAVPASASRRVVDGAGRTLTLPDRPHRIEPRAVKRRPKKYTRLNRPRHELRQALLKATG